MAVGKTAGKSTSGWNPQTKWQGAKSTAKNQDGVKRRPADSTKSSTKKSIKY